MTHILTSPLSVPTPKATFPLNLNHYRNAHYRVLNHAKINYKLIMREQIFKLPVFEKIKLEFVLYPNSRAKCDLDNVCSVHNKFFSDALVEMGKIKDDNYLFITEISYKFGEVLPKNGKVEVTIEHIAAVEYPQF